MPTKEREEKHTDAEALTIMLQEKNRQIQMLRKQLEMSDEYGRNLHDLLQELVRLLTLIDQ